MRSNLARSTRGAFVVTSALVLGACGGGDGGSSSDGGASPLEAIFGGAESSAEMRAKQLEQEELVAQCMREAGWEYTPVDWEAQFGNDAAADDAELSPEEYGEKYFYGITRSYELYELPYLLGEENPDVTTPEFVDPNSEYVQSLTADEQTQYYEDLQGPPWEPPLDEEGGDAYVPPPLEEQGCYGQASAEVYGESPWNDPEISTRMNELFEDLENAPSVKAAQQDWKTCMDERDEDYDFKDANSVYQYFERRKFELGGAELVETDFDVTTGEPLDPDIDTSNLWTSSYDENGEGYVVIGQPEALTESEIETLRTEEQTVWTDDQACQDESDLLDARRDAEQELVDKLLAEFPQLEDAGSGAGQG